MIALNKWETDPFKVEKYFLHCFMIGDTDGVEAALKELDNDYLSRFESVAWRIADRCRVEMSKRQVSCESHKILEEEE